VPSTLSKRGGNHADAFTRVELLVVLLVLALLSLVSLGIYKSYLELRKSPVCVNNLKELGVAVKMNTGNSFRFHMQQSMGNGGTKEFTTGLDTFRHFQALSNIVTNPKLLVCPSDARVPAASFQSLANSNVSYFIGLKGDETKLDAILAGDRLFSGNVPQTNGVLVAGTNGAFKWSASYHRNYKLQTRGNVLMSSGSVWLSSDNKLTELLKTKENFDNPLLFPD